MSEGPSTVSEIDRRRARLVAAQAMRVDSVTAEVVDSLEAAGIQSILLKGPSFARWLYAEGASRPYGDTDLLVPARSFADAGQRLEALGFEVEKGTPPGTWELHGLAWRRADGGVVDLHRTLVGVGSGDRIWDELWSHTELQHVGGSSVRVLDEVARALHVALHAAQHGHEERKVLEDLRRAATMVAPGVWQDAAALAVKLQALPAFAAGLSLDRGGRSIAAALELDGKLTTEVVLRLSNAGPAALGLEHWLRERGIRARAAHLRRKVLPSPSWMRERTVIARRGAAGLGMAYLYRFGYLMAHAPRAIRARQVAKAAASSGFPKS